MESKKINQLATEMSPASTDLTIIGDPITGVSKKITLEQISSLFASSISFYTNYAAFPATGSVDTLYCAKDTKKLYLWSGSAYVEVFPSQALLDTYQLRSEKASANGYASLDGSGKVPSAQLPSYVDDVIEVANYAALPVTGETGKIYITLDNNKVYRWTGSVYVEIAANNAIWGNITGTLSFQTDLQNALNAKVPTSRTLSINGTSYDLSANRTWSVGTVTSVAVTESVAALSITGSPITTSGTINIGFAGASTEYVAGDGSLVTFPTVVTQAQNLVTEVYNETGATLTKGTVVYINGGHGNLPTITKALATGDSTSAQTYGVVRTDITNNNNGYVTVIGNIDNIDTQAYAAGTQLYLSSTTAGAWTSTKQYAPAHLVYVGIVTRSHPTQGVVEVRIQNGFEMDELHNVSAQSPSNNDGIFYNTSTSLWEKKSIATVLGFTPANAALVVPYTGATGNVTLGAYKLTATNLEVLGATASIKATDTGAQLGIGVAANSGAISIASNGNVYLNSDVYLDTGYIGSGGGMLKYSSIGKLTKAVAGTDYQVPITLTTTGTSGAATFSSGTLNIPQYQAALTNPVTGTGTTNYITKWSSSSAATSSVIYDNGTNVGIGTTSPNDYSIGSTAKVLQVTGSAYGIINANAGSVYAWLIADTSTAATGTQSNHDFKILTNNTERMRINTSGNVGIGSSSITNGTTFGGVLQTNLLKLSASGYPALEINTTSDGGGSLQFTYGTNLPNQVRAYVGFNGGSGTVNDFWLLNLASNGTLLFGTANAEKMRLTSGGKLLIGKTTSSLSDSIVEASSNFYSAGSTSGFFWENRSGGSTFYGWYTTSGTIYLYNGSANIASINTTTGVYTPLSDINKKKDFEDSTIGLNAILGLKPTLYRMKDEEDTEKHLGFIAQEVKDFIPQAYIQTKGEKEDFIGLDYQAITATLVKAIQELEVRLKTLENK